MSQMVSNFTCNGMLPSSKEINKTILSITKDTKLSILSESMDLETYEPTNTNSLVAWLHSEVCIYFVVKIVINVFTIPSKDDFDTEERSSGSVARNPKLFTEKGKN